MQRVNEGSIPLKIQGNITAKKLTIVDPTTTSDDFVEFITNLNEN